MSLDKAIQHGKEKRKRYYGAKAVDCTCRNHGSCSYCLDARMHSTKKQYGKVEDQEADFWASVAGYDDPTDVEMDRADDLMERFGFDPKDPYDMVRSGMWWNPKIDEELKAQEDV